MPVIHRLPAIRRLPEGVVNRIAAGEVVERPASVVKELVENAVDAGATSITVRVEQGGRALIRVDDDGCGIAAAELPLALQRHATSKLADDHLTRITTLGFRGEALPSIAAVSRLRLTTRAAGEDTAWLLVVEGGEAQAPRPVAGACGTRIEVRDLFYKVPARLGFLRSARAEGEAIEEIVRRLALAVPAVGLRLEIDGRLALHAEGSAGDLLPGHLEPRLKAVLGREFLDSAIRIEADRAGVALTGYAGLPTYSRKDGRHQYLAVNGRPVQDRLLKAALRAAYSDLLFHDRQPVAALSVVLAPGEVDVNVHPAKAEVRFRDPGLVRGLIVGGLKRALAEHGHRAAPANAAPTLASFATGPGLAEHAAPFGAERLLEAPPAARASAPVGDGANFPLGAARAQLHGTYIVAETPATVVLVDQHAAHERIVYERMKAELARGGVARQALLIPEIVELEAGDRARVLTRGAELLTIGIALEPFGDDAVVVREMPALLRADAAAGLVRDLASDLAELDSALALSEALDRVLARLACHGSVRAGRQLGIEEMNALLREMERTPFAGQCNHGRPTYIELKRGDIERLFGRRGA